VINRKRFLAALLFSLTALPLAAQINDTYVVPAAANVRAAFGTRWQTRLSIFNPQTDIRCASASRTSRPAAARETRCSSTSRAIRWRCGDNVVGSLFHRSDTGAILIATFPEDNPGVEDKVLARAVHRALRDVQQRRRRHVRPDHPRHLDWSDGLHFDGVSAVAHGISNVAAQGWRTNIGAVNLGRNQVTINVTVYDYDATRSAATSRSSSALGHFQDRLPVEVNRGSIEFTVSDPTQQAVVFPYVSTVDQLSGDPTYQSPTLLASAKYLYGKGAAASDALLSPGRRIDVSFARNVRESAKAPRRDGRAAGLRPMSNVGRVL